MARARRIEQGLRRVAALEAEYRDRLLRELECCAAGVWGLFGQNEYVGAHAADIQALIELGDEIDAARAKLGERPFELHARFLALRGRQSEHQPGEPKLALQLLSELAPKDRALSPEEREAIREAAGKAAAGAFLRRSARN